MRLRPYKSCDAKYIAAWLADREVFIRWSGGRFGSFPLDEETIDGKYSQLNGGCDEDDNFYPWTAVDENGKPIGHFVIRYTGGDSRQLRFAWVVVDSSVRGRGIGSSMLSMGLDFAFNFLKAERVTIGVFADNAPARRCYKKLGFCETETAKCGEYDVVEMQILKKDYLENKNN